jgi:hypothetical protein
MADDDIRLQIVKWVWEKRDDILAALKTVRDWFRTGDSDKQKPGILILGPGGAG